MKKILLSVYPKYCKLIFNSEKTIEVRRTRPKLEPPFEVLVYETKGKTKYWSQPLPIPYTEGGGKVIGSFVCDKIDMFDSEWSEYAYSCAPHDIPCAMPMSEEKAIRICQEKGCLTLEDIIDYFGDEEWRAYFWNITEPKLFDKPKELSEFYIPCKWYEKGKGCPEDCALFDYEGAIDDTDDFCLGKRPITRPPQSFCYIEEYPKC